MSVQINVVGEYAADVIKELSVLGFHHAPAAPVTELPKPDKPARSRNTTKQEPEKKEEPKQPDPEPQQDEDEDIDDLLGGDDAESDDSIPTDVELRAAAAEAGKRIKKAGKDHRPVIKAVLDKYGSPNVTGVPADKRIAFKRELEAL